MAEIRFIAAPAPVIKAALADLGSWRVLGERFKGRSKQLCPVARSSAQGGSSGSPGSLRDSIQVRFEYGSDPRILVGSTLTRSNQVSALGLILEGTSAHPIDPVNARALRFTSGGQVVFAGHVDHPGTKKNEFVQRAIREVILESVSLRL